jgi:hypothetical protein
MQTQKKSVYDLDFKIIETRSPAPNLVALCEDSFSLWHREWLKTFEDLHVQRALYADDFLDKEIGGLFYGNRPVGLLFYSWFNINRPSHLKHSYFKDYPPGVIDSIVRRGHENVMVITYMTLDPKWRRQFTDVPVSEMLIGLAAKRFLQSDSTALIGYFRNNKKTNEMFYRHGGIRVLKNAKTYNVDVDYAILTKESACESQFPGVSQAVGTLWNQWQLPKTSKKAA